MEKILFDFTIYQSQRQFHGGGEYGYAVLNALLERKTECELGIFFLTGKRVDKTILKRCQEQGVSIHPCTDYKNLPSIIINYQYTTIYSALAYNINWNKLKLPTNIRLVLTVHGLRTLELAGEDKYQNGMIKKKFNRESFQDWYNRKYFLNEIIAEEKRKAYDNVFKVNGNKKIITVSEHSKHSIMKYYPEIQSWEIEVLYSPPKISPILLDEIKESKILNQYGIHSKNYGLIVSAGIWYKNAVRGSIAFDKVFDREYSFIPKDYKVIILGVSDKNIFMGQVKHHERFILENYVEEEKLEVLYKNAHLFLYPSLNEGFGYPPLEAMKYETLCACSVNTSIAEVCREMVLYFNPLSIDEMENRIMQSFSFNIREEMKERIRRLLPLVQQRQQEDLKRLTDIIIGK